MDGDNFGRRGYDRPAANITELEWGRLLEKMDGIAKCQEQLRLDFKEFSTDTRAKLENLSTMVVNHENKLETPKTLWTGAKIGGIIVVVCTFALILLFSGKFTLPLFVLSQ